MESQTEMERAIESATEYGSAQLADVCSYLAGDSSCYEESTGDQSSFGRWAALFEFNEDETQMLVAAKIIAQREADNAFDWSTRKMVVTYTTTDWSRDTYFGRATYDDVQEEYSRFCTCEHGENGEDCDADSPAICSADGCGYFDHSEHNAPKFCPDHKPRYGVCSLCTTAVGENYHLCPVCGATMPEYDPAEDEDE